MKTIFLGVNFWSDGANEVLNTDRLISIQILRCLKFVLTQNQFELNSFFMALYSTNRFAVDVVLKQTTLMWLHFHIM